MLSNIFNAIKANLISGGAYYLIAKAVFVTLIVIVIAWITAIIFGAVCSYYMCYKKKVISRIAESACFLFRSTPALLIMLLMYYVFFKTSHISTTLLAGLAIGFYGAGHLSEIITKSVKESQVCSDPEVMKRLKDAYYTAALPQALEDTMFSIKRLMIQLVQWTTIVGYISVNDLTQVMMQIGQRTMYPFFAISFCVLFHLVLVILIELGYSIIIKKFKENQNKYID